MARRQRKRTRTRGRSVPQELQEALRRDKGSGKTWAELAAEIGLSSRTLRKMVKEGARRDRHTLEIVGRYYALPSVDNEEDLNTDLLKDPEQTLFDLSKQSRVPERHEAVLVAFLSDKKSLERLSNAKTLGLFFNAQASALRSENKLANAGLSHLVASHLREYPEERVQHLLFASSNVRYATITWKENLREAMLTKLLAHPRPKLPKDTLAQLFYELGNIAMDSLCEYDLAEQLESVAYKYINEIAEEGDKLLHQKLRVLIREGYIKLRKSTKSSLRKLDEARELLGDSVEDQASILIPSIILESKDHGEAAAYTKIVDNASFLEQGTGASTFAISGLVKDFGRISGQDIPQHIRNVLDRKIAEGVKQGIRIQRGGLLGLRNLNTCLQYAVVYEPLLTADQIKAIAANFSVTVRH